MTSRALSLSLAAFAVIAVASTHAAPAPDARPSLTTVVDRMEAYIDAFERRMGSVVAEEDYRQTLVTPSAAANSEPARYTRILKSDYALLRATGRDEWVGFRDTFEVDGKPVRDHDERLQQLVTTGVLAAAARIANESARFNLAPDLVVRNINVPTLVLHLLRPVNRERFSFKHEGEETIGRVRAWRIDYRERDRPTLVKAPDGNDEPSRGAVWVDPDSGEVWKTMIQWRVGATTAFGLVTVTYGHAPGIETLVPLTMFERYQPGVTTLEGTATYSAFRQFHTDARIVAP